MADVHRHPTHTIVELDRSYDALEAGIIEELGDLLQNEVAIANPPRLILNFEHTVYMGSSVLEVLFRTWKRVNERKGRMIICNLTPFCAEVLHITRLDRIFDIEADLPGALAALHA